MVGMCRLGAGEYTLEGGWGRDRVEFGRGDVAVFAVFVQRGGSHGR